MKTQLLKNLLLLLLSFSLHHNLYPQTVVYVPGTASTAPNYATVNEALTDASNDLRIVLTAPVDSPPNGFAFPAGRPGRIVEFFGSDTLVAIIDGTRLNGTSSLFGSGAAASVYYMGDRLGTLKFNGVKVVNAHTDGNGSILNTNSPVAVVVENSVFDSNTAAVDGGAFYIRHDTSIPNPMVFRNSTLRRNSAARGGFAYLQNRGVSVSIEFDNCNINNNSATGTSAQASYGGGVISISPLTSIYGSEVSINNCEIKDNSSLADGGLFYVTNQVDGAAINTIRINQSTISRNTSINNGGAFYYGRGYYDVLIQASVFEDNRAQNDNGAVFYLHRFTGENSSFVIDQSRFARNIAGLGGAVLYTGELANGSIFNVRNNSVFTENTSMRGSGGVFTILTVGNNVRFDWSNFSANNNRAGEDGGVLFNGGSGSNFSFINTNCNFQNNVAGADEVFDPNAQSYKGGGGVMYVGLIGSDASFNWDNVNFVSNTARTGGGGVFYTDEVEPRWNFLMNRLTVTNNSSGRHGGALNLGEGIGALSNITVRNSTFENNESLSEWGGGAIVATRMLAGGNTEFNFEDVSFRGNSAVERGGAIALGGFDNTNNFSFNISRVNYSDNISNLGGGAMHVTNGTVNISESLLTGNQVLATGVEGVGGGIYFDYADVTINNSTFVANTADNGGAIYHQRSFGASTTNSVFVNNVASANAGANYHSLNSLDTEYYNCVFAGNTAGIFAGAIYQRASGGTGAQPVPIVNCTFYNNSTTNANNSQTSISAGALFSHTASNVANCVFYNNTSPSLSPYNDVNFFVPASSTITTSSMQLPNLAAYNNPTAAGVSLFGNTNPGFINVSNILGASGTGRSTDAGLRLTNSSMIDAGTNAMNPTITDLAGTARIQSRIDMGAYEGVTSLPVRLVKFTVTKEAETAILAWSTTMEENSCCFEIQHSANGSTWKTIGKVNALNNTNERQEYSFKHNVGVAELTSYKTNYYRLKMIDIDNKFAYSMIRSIEANGGLKYSFYPNPATEKFNINSLDLSSLVNLDIVNLYGVTVQRNLPPYEAEGIDITNLNSGMYIVKMKFANGHVVTGKISVLK